MEVNGAGGLIFLNCATDESLYSLHDGFLFLGDYLCIPEGSLWFLLMKEAHNSGHFGRDKTIVLLKNKFFWPSMDQNVSLYVKRCHVCQIGKGTSSNAGKYTLLPIFEGP